MSAGRCLATWSTQHLSTFPADTQVVIENGGEAISELFDHVTVHRNMYGVPQGHYGERLTMLLWFCNQGRWGFHQWSLWTVVEKGNIRRWGKIVGIMQVQKRTCERCKLEQLTTQEIEC